MKQSLSFFIALILFVFLMIRPAIAEETTIDVKARTSDTLTLYLENDFFAKTDRYYTSGIKISWISRDLSKYREIEAIPNRVHEYIERIPLINNAEQQRSVSLSFGQNIYTPEDKDNQDLIEDDRPYAGITYLGLGLHSRSSQHMDTLELDVGIIGPHSYAEEIQKDIHRWNGSRYPRGWKHQLKDEPILNLFFERKWKVVQWISDSGQGFDWIPHTGVALGNAYTGVNMGGQVRFGWNIPNDFGTYLIRPGSESSAPLNDKDPRFLGLFHSFGLHFFFAVDGKAVLRNIMLDGNTFRDSHSVEKEPFVADLIGGVGIMIYRVKITYSYVYQTKEFKRQRDEQSFGAIALSFTF
jgi:hypothetical protein